MPKLKMRIHYSRINKIVVPGTLREGLKRSQTSISFTKKLLKVTTGRQYGIYQNNKLMNTPLSVL